MGNLVTALSVLVILGAVGCSANPSPAPESKATQPETKSALQPASSAQDERIFEETCSKCHPTARPKAYKGGETWSSIVERMINARKAPITPENASRIIAYLEKSYPKKGAS